MRDQDILDAIAQSVHERGYPPTHREIAALAGQKSPSSGWRMVKRLADKGLVEVAPTRSRGITITKAGMKAMTEEM